MWARVPREASIRVRFHPVLAMELCCLWPWSGLASDMLISSVVVARDLEWSLLFERLRETVGGGFLLPCAREDELFPGPALCLSRRMCGGRVFLGHGV